MIELTAYPNVNVPLPQKNTLVAARPGEPGTEKKLFITLGLTEVLILVYSYIHIFIGFDIRPFFSGLSLSLSKFSFRADLFLFLTEHKYS